MVFFQYWVSFFSTIFLVYSYVVLTGSTEWFVINILLQSKIITVANTTTHVVAVLLLFAFFLKLGIAPFQVFKVEVYTGLPYLSIFFYTIYYFLIFFTFFIFFLFNMIPGFIYYYNLIIFFFTLFGIIYLINLLFDITYIKVFLAYSTVLNSIGFLILLLANL